jgi:hypothetical protein
MRPLPSLSSTRFRPFSSAGLMFPRPGAHLGGLRARGRHWSRITLILLLLASPAALLGAFAWHTTPNAPLGPSRTQDAANQAKLGATYGKMPLYFVENQGQTDARVAYYAHGQDTSIFFTPQGVTYALTTPGVPATSSAASHSTRAQPGHKAVAAPETARRRWAVAVDFVGANPAIKPRGEERTPTVVSYFRGPRAEWKTGLPTYQRVVYADLWPGIDLVYEGTAAGALEYSFLLQPGADPQQIQLAYRGATTVTRSPSGRLEVNTPVGSWTEDIPYAYQEGPGGQRTPITATHILKAGAAEETPVYSFALGAYDRSQPLVLDPVVFIYSGFIGGAGFDQGNGIAVDSTGNAYITGQTSSDETTFPVTVGPDPTFNGSFYDAFVAKVKSDGSALAYLGYIGGAGGFSDVGQGIAMDKDGNAYVAGSTSSDQTTFPVMVGPDLTFNGGGDDAFVAKVRADGTGLVYCGYIGGAGSFGDSGKGIAVDSFGKAYVTGATSSNQLTFPVKGGPDLTFNGVDEDAFVAKVRADGTGLIYAGYIGGHENDFGFAIAVDAAGSAYVTGGTNSIKGFPVKVGPDLSFNGGGFDAFVTKIAQLVFVPFPLPILIQPGSSIATLNPASRGELPVAILSTDEFDATVDVDLATVRFGATGTEAAPLRATRADVNEDGLPDLLLHVAIPDTGIACGTTTAALSGRTVDGQEIRGSALIQTVGCTIRR